MTLISSVTLEQVEIDGVSAAKGEPLEYFNHMLGGPDRCEMPTIPSPYGYRDNVIYFFDQYGIVMNEHHATRLIQEIEFVFDPIDARHKTKQPYTGHVNVCGVSVRAGMPFAEFAELCNLTFTPHLGHAWYLDGENISIQFEVKRQGPKGKRKQEIITELAVGFRGAHNKSLAQDATATPFTSAFDSESSSYDLEK